MQPPAAETLQALACPACKARALQVEGSALCCAGCSATYPLLRGIPCLPPDVALWRGLYLRRLSDYLWTTASRIRQFEAEQALPELLPRTRERLRSMIEAKENERRTVARLFEPLRSTVSAEASADVPVREEAGNVRLPLLECYENVFRDWVWGAPEIARCCSLIERLLPQATGTLVVFGAGAGRLALEVHKSLKPSVTFALDVNPLPLLIAERLLKGEVLSLYEFPVCPRSSDHFTVYHRIEAAERIPLGFQLMIADALHPPFADGSLDVVLTPWFIDAVSADLRVTAAGINRALKPGGIWLNLGPLQFDTVLSRAYQIEEVQELIEQAGFRRFGSLQQDLPYFDSPYNGSLRTDTVFGFAAKKVSESAQVIEPDARAAWIRNPSLPIPVTPEVGNMGRRSAFTAATLSLIDGKRSLSDLAEALAPSAGTEPKMMQEQLQAFFSKLPLS